MPACAAAPSSAFAVRRLGPGDLDAVEALHRLVTGPVPRPEIIKPERRDYFAEMLEGRGRVIGLFDAGGMLIAYGILQHDHTPGDGPHQLLGLPAEAAVGRLAGASVHPAHRGQRLQQVVIAARVEMAPKGMVLFSTAAPANVPSWSNLLAGGFPIRDIQLFFGGYARYVMVHDGSRHDPSRAVVVNPTDTARQKELFAKGWRGYARVRRADGGVGLLVAPPLPADL